MTVVVNGVKWGGLANVQTSLFIYCKDDRVALTQSQLKVDGKLIAESVRLSQLVAD